MSLTVDEQKQQLLTDCDVLNKVVDFIKQEIVILANIDIQQVNVQASIGDFGLDSISLIQLKIKLDEFAGIELDLDQFLENPSIYSIANKLTEIIKQQNNHFVGDLKGKSTTIPEVH